MNKRERFKLYELPCLEGNSGFNHLDKTLNEFLSDNFENGVPRKDDYYKFPIRQLKKNSPKKKQNNEKNQKNEMKKFRKRKGFWFNEHPNNPKFDLLSLSKKFNKKRTKNSILYKSKEDNKNNLNNEFSNNNLEILSFDSTPELQLRSP